MKNRNTLLGLAVALLLAAGIGWWVKQAPVEKAVVESSPAKPAVQVAMPIIPHKAEVVAPTAPVVDPSANPPPAETPVAASNPDADLNTAVNDLITTLQGGDVNAFVQNYMAPFMMETAAARNPNVNVTPEMKAQMEQMLILQTTNQLTQRPNTMQVFQKMAAALQSAQATPPQMNEAGDRATYNLQTNGDKDLPSSIFFVRQDGKWSLDFMSMAQSIIPPRPDP